MLFQSYHKTELGLTYDSGAVIYQQGGPGDCLFVILEGRVELAIEDPAIGWISLEILEKDEVFGATAVFDELPRTVTARAVGPTRLLSIDRKAFLQRIGEDPALALRILLKMSSRIRRLVAEVVHWRKRSVGFDPEEEAPDAVPPAGS